LPQKNETNLAQADAPNCREAARLLAIFAVCPDKSIEPAVHASDVMFVRTLASFLVLAFVAAGCNSEPAVPKLKAPKKARVTRAAAAPKASFSTTIEPPNIPTSDHYGLPFAWEKANDEPLGQTRTFLSEVLRDNEKYLQRGKAFFDELTRTQKPRATVLTCADSRVQSGAWDETPENDDYTIRNLGNQVLTALGSVQYGVEQLNTPVLFILGHTDCRAVKAVLDHDQSLPKPILKELEGIKPAPASTDKKRLSAWADAVVDNVHQQVRVALDKFGSRVVTGKLTVIGAIYDMNDDLGKGTGSISIVDVNGNSEVKRLRAFVAAVQEAQPREKGASAVPSGELTAPDPELRPSTPAASATTPTAKNDDLKAVFIDVPGLVTNSAVSEK
jgi:carbonic anhydrase